ncbi:MAG: UvrD-helicase domain-containing protein [Myxococcota bacterium]
MSARSKTASVERSAEDSVRAYLSFLAEGVGPEQAIAITFTRKAAAELKDRVSLALRACLGGPAGEQARRRLGSAWPAYREVAPTDPAAVRDALARLPEAPIGTTDAFVQQLLTEFALDAALPLPDGRAVPLDLPITPGAGVQRALVRAARRVLDPPDRGAPDPDVALLVRYFPFDRLLEEIARRNDLDHLPIATSREVLGATAVWLAEVLLRHDLAAAYEVTAGADAAGWAAALEARTNRSGKWAVPAVADWLSAGADPSRAPFALCGWLQGLDQRSRPRKLLREALESEIRSFGPAELSLWQVVEALKVPYDDPAQVDLADQLRAARWRLRRRVTTDGLEQAALGGELGYDELLEAAIASCEAPSPRLRRRFRALLVDEVQDADPRQIRLYDALSRLSPDLRSYFVGDARQSIYLFRGAEPDGIRALASGLAPVELATNRRSAPALVAAQRALFGALAAPMRARRWRSLGDLSQLAHDPDNAGLALDPATHAPDAPVWLVVPGKDRVGWGKAGDEDLDDRALSTFWRRLGLARAEPGHAGDTAAVLAPTWSLAERACRRLREWSGRADAAFVESSPGRAGGRVTDDLRVWLQAFLDRGHAAAWVGVFKHPSVGLSDRALARLSSGAGLAAEWHRRPGFWLEVEALAPPHDEVDIRAFARAREPLRIAAERIGRTSTAAALDAVVTALDWRAVIGAGPGGQDEVAELEVLLDWIRDHDADGVPADAILALLDDDRAEKPHVHVERPVGHVACTTIFQAKGLAWDHVCVLRPGRHARLDAGRDHDVGWMALPDGRRVRLEGLRFDPGGGLLEYRDPLGRLAARIHENRYTEEAARLAYVAITRARRSVTTAIVGSRGKGAGFTLPDLLDKAWVGPALAGVAVVEAPPVPAPGPPPVGRAAPTGAARVVRTPNARTWEERAPSSFGAHLDPEVRARHVEQVVARIRLSNGLHLGRSPVHPAGTDPRTGAALPGAALAHLQPYDWGNVAHGWFAVWRFQGDPDPAEVAAHLVAEWGAAPPEVVAWLVAMCRQLVTVQGPIWRWVTDPDAKLWFEHPLLGLGGFGKGEEVLLSGRTDLLVERSGTIAVIDFKAGATVPTGYPDLDVTASLRSYAFQLEAYAGALRRMGKKVDTVALWFVRSGASVRWTPG